MNALPDIAETDIKILRSPRRTRVVLRVTKNGALELLLPQNYPASAVPQLLHDNKNLIRRLREQAERKLRSLPEFSDNSRLFFLGKTYPVFTSIRLKQFDGERFMIPAGELSDRLDILEDIYKKLAKKHIIPRVSQLAEKFHISIGSIRINSAVTRWGSCSSSGNLNFSWHLVRCPEELIDSVICHELAHRFVLDHSPRFYQQLRKIDPLFAEHRHALRLFAKNNPWFR